MKKTIITFALFATLGAVNAQTSPNKDQASTMTSGVVAKPVDISEELGLNGEQRSKASQVTKEYAKAVRDLQNSGLDEEGQGPRRAVLRKGRDQRLGMILNEEQMKKLLVLREESNDQDLVPEAPSAK